MASFKYSAYSPDGTMNTGVVDAESGRAARLTLRGRGLFPLDVADVGEAPGAGLRWRGGSRTIWPGRRRLRDAELCILTRIWAELLASGLSIEHSLSALMDQAESETARAVLAATRSEILAGYALSAALERSGGEFPMIYRAAVAAGEKSGQLSSVMVQLAEYLERRNHLRQKTLQALLYPAIVATVALLVVIGLMAYVIPSVVTVFEQGRQTLPWLTRSVIAISSLLREWGWLLAAALAMSLVATRRALRNEALRRRWDARLLRLPLIGRYLRMLEATRFASTLSILVGSGVPIIAALDAGRQVLVRLPLRDAVAQAADRLREGMSLARALDQSAQFPPLLIHMIASGEASGQLHALLGRAAQLQQTEIEHRTAVLTTLMEPLLLLAMGGVVLVIVLAVMQPIIELNQLLH